MVMRVSGWSVNNELKECNESLVCPRSRCKHAACLRAGVIYVFGGKDANIPLNDVWSYDIETGSWKRIVLRGDRMPALQEHTVVLYKNDLYLFGGSFLYGSDDTAPFWAIDVDKCICTKLAVTEQQSNDVRTQTNGCSSQASYPVGRRGHTAVIYGNSMYIYGGYVDMKGSSGELWQFNFDETCWTAVNSVVPAAESPVGRQSHSAVVHRHRMWVYGGLSGLTALDDLWTWHFDVQKWVQVRCRSCPAALEGHSACIVGNSMFVFGGCTDGAPQNNLWQFDFDFLTWTRLTIDGFTPTPCTKQCAVVVTRHQTSRRNHSMPTRCNKTYTGVDLQRASTGHRHRRQKQTDVLRRSVLDSQQSVETTMTELRTDRDGCSEKAAEADVCCDVCTSALRRNHRVNNQPINDFDAVINSSREQLILEPDSYVISAIDPLTQQQADKSPNNIAECSCQHGAVNPTFVSDDVTLRHCEGFIVSNGEHNGCHDHVVAAQALMQPLNGHRSVELDDSSQLISEAPVELMCYSLCQNGTPLIVEDLEHDSGILSSDTTLVELSVISHPPLDVREAWPDNNSLSSARDSNGVNHQKQLAPADPTQPEIEYSIYIFGGRDIFTAPNLEVKPMPVSRFDVCYGT